MRGTSLSMRFTMAAAGLVVLAMFLANLVFAYAGKGRTDAEFTLFAYQRASWLAGELESRLTSDKMDRETRKFLSRSAREMDLSIVLLKEGDDPLITAHGPSLTQMLRTLKEYPELGRLTDTGETPWEPAFDGSTDRNKYPDRGRRPMRVQEVWPYAVEAPVRSRLTLRVVPLSQKRLDGNSTSRGLVGVGLALLLLSGLVGGRMARPLEELSAQVTAARRGGAAARVPHQPFEEAQRIAVAVNDLLAGTERAEAAREQLIQTLTDAFRTPVHRLAEHSDAVDLSAVPPPARPPVQAMQEEAEELRGVVDDLHSWTELAAKRAELDLEEVDIRHLLEEASAGQPGDITVTVDDDVEELIQADEAWLRLLLHHLITNGCQHGGGQVDVHCSRGHTKIEVAVRDHGDGIEDFDVLRQVGNAFFGPGGDGMGLGLTIVQQVVELHRGGLRTRNHPEGGLEVKLWLPAPPIRISEPDRENEELWNLSGEHPRPQPKPHQLGPDPADAARPPAEPTTAGDTDQFEPF